MKKNLLVLFVVVGLIFAGTKLSFSAGLTTNDACKDTKRFEYNCVGEYNIKGYPKCGPYLYCLYSFESYPTKKCHFDVFKLTNSTESTTTIEDLDRNCYYSSKEYDKINYNEKKYKDCLASQKRLIETFKAGYCKRIYTEKRKINGQNCSIAYYYDRSRKIIHSITCNGKVKIVNKLPNNFDENCYKKDDCKNNAGNNLKQQENNNNNTKPSSDSKNIQQQNNGNSNQQYHPKFIKIEDNQELIKKFENMN